jgi:hypothetical protein
VLDVIVGNKQLALSGFDKPKQTKRKLMHFVDVGEFPDGTSAAHFVCPRFGHDDGWSRVSMTETRRGIPCPKCNKA